MNLLFKTINGQSCWVLTTPRAAVIISRAEAEHIYRIKVQQARLAHVH
ncbi:hypothetical protein [Photobacterium halotolerans]|uniref:Uncharacterized protein n=1 Tax=Photobacterium halotolerans TaxID=265726 RepID=A0A7X4W8C8_9GAMM|nr:hypothetical protein [Photobacterium halotolerans]NAW63973.1 hypothetical protein [Photobacterium halotolerans]